ncbi:ATPase components of ABC transporters with duplicated ATPase domains [Sporobacter termitidis DSM 10068]|uniref:ATPase components of ABC transporters with duplicated ATPase domains n=1 Tax=Sporobacter termitidis DSM 10068 TaxID=1123282 RepID=A0A1M5TB71_9FIRM|nr:ABC-F family ATP-binding cassette domain-containing protein [Sporobacter termitidis]SHH47948.1 ATPase components of ABC transporters with duplicated ATPase domains [Sporobacter termitidis DSM 10068]
MVDISIQNVTKAFEEGKDILDGLTFDINEGEHVGLLGKNGAGKTTLFRIIAGEYETDEGEVVIPKNKKLGLISQIPKYPAGYTVEDVLICAQQRLLDIRARMEALERRMGESDAPELLREYDALAFDYERSGGYDLEFERNRVANGLEIPRSQRDQLFSTLSGGEKTRVNLARLILEDTDILLLDEPTNHLDIGATEWLEAYLGKYKGTVLIISHDRYFLDSAVTRTIEISNGKAEFFGGNYSFYVEEKERRYQEQLKKYEWEQAEAKRLQESADRLYQWGTGNKNLMKKSFAIQSRIERIVQTERPAKEKHLSARFGERGFHGDEVLVMKGVSKTFEGKKLFSDVELTITGGERIALIGDNGTGKSTLIKIILDELRPDAGIVKKGPSVKTAYLPQLIHFTHPYRTLVDTLVYEDGCTPQTARNRLGGFKFYGEDVFKQVSDLSGGEQSRLRLCALMKDDVNFLILDEPTNHLDIVSREWIEEAVEDFGETLLFVSHDRYFINRFATRVWELEGGRINDFRGTYEKYRATKAMQTKQESAPKEARTVRKEKPKRAGSTEKQIARLEREIAALEESLKKLAEQKNEFCADYEKLMELDGEEAALQSQLDDKYDAWAALSP